MSNKYVITIGRQFGSGGRELGKALSKKLGIPYYDKELLLKAAEESGICADFFIDNDEKVPTFFGGTMSFSFGFNPMPWYTGNNSISEESLYKVQSDIMHKIASEGPCIIVGRSADYVLRDLPNVINIFVHATKEDCAKRIISRNDSVDIDKAMRMAERTNKLRADFYNFYTDKKWGDAASYDITLNSSVLPIDDLADIVIEYLKKKTQNA